MMVFDRQQVRRQRDRAAQNFEQYDFLFREVAGRVVDRLKDINRRFPTAWDVGAHSGALADRLSDAAGVETLIQSDLSSTLLRRSPIPRKIVCDEEALPIAPGSLDLAVSTLSLHWVNDLPGSLLQVRQSLRPDGLFIGTLFGGDTLRELRHCLAEAEMEIVGGIHQRASPFTDVRDVGGLLQRAGFALPVVDSDLIEVSYESAFALMRDLRGMGEANAVLTRPKNFTRRSVLFRAAEMYHERFAGADGRIKAVFQVLFLTGWAPAQTQQKPLRPGSAQSRLATALQGSEIGLGESTDGRTLSVSKTPDDSD